VVLWALAILVGLAACKREEKAAVAEPRPVRTVVAAYEDTGERVVLTGHVRAEDEADFAFRIGGRMTERPVNLGERVQPGQLLARLDPQNEMNEFRTAQAAVAAAQAAVTETRANFERQRTLLAQGHTPRAQFDAAERALRTARAQADDAEARLGLAADRVSFTMLTADAEGTVTARGAEPGEVVQAGQMIVRVARQGGRDAVFDVPAQLLRSAPADPRVTVTLADDPSVQAEGRVREVAAQADPVTRTFEVKVGLANPPPAMLLGATVNGTLQLDGDKAMALPASALTATSGRPAVWVVDPKTGTVALRNVELLRHDPATAVVAHGLAPGEIVVTAGVQALHPGQKVRLLQAAS
jgi:RND family efflux transporter MFP subunit